MANCKAFSCYNSTYSSIYEYCSYHNKCLEKVRKKHSDVNNVKSLETFETYFNKNCGWLVNYNSSKSSSNPFQIWIAVYEPKNKENGELLSVIQSGAIYNNLPTAEREAKELKKKLQNNGFDDTPMLEIHPNSHNWRRFSVLIDSPYVLERYMPQTREQRHGSFLAPGYMDVEVPVDNVNDYAKVLDVLKVECSNYWHVGIYIGNGKVCHFSKERNGTYIGSWSDFKKFDGFEGNIDNSRATIYHPVIPFKNPRKTAEQIAWAVNNNFRKNNYSLLDRNCEHFANMVVYGINYSEQIEESKGSSFISFFRNGSKNNGKNPDLILVDEMKESNSKLNERCDWLSDQIKANIEVPTKKENCIIM